MWSAAVVIGTLRIKILTLKANKTDTKKIIFDTKYVGQKLKK